MSEIGINKLLYDRRISLGYSLKEASIRLDISKAKLSLIENGYKKVKNKELQERFIKRYKLEENFFEQNELGYPSPIEVKKSNAELADKKYVKFFKKLWVKIALVFLTVLNAGVLATGFAIDASYKAPELFSKKYNKLANNAKENGRLCIATESKTSEMLLCTYRSLEYVHETDSNGFYYESINFMPQYDDYIGYAFFKAEAYVDLKDITKLDLGYAKLYFESRMTEEAERLHFTCYSESDLLVPVVHFSVDYDMLTNKYTYNLIEAKNGANKLSKDNADSFNASIYKFVFEKMHKPFEEAKANFIDENKPMVYYNSLEDFNADQIGGLLAVAILDKVTLALVIVGVVLTTVFLALFVLSIIITTKFGKKVYAAVSIETEEAFEESDKNKRYKKLPKNRLFAPFIPEAAIRVVAFILMVVGSMSIYYIFESIMNKNIVGTLLSLDYRASVASFSLLGMILIFFIKLDIIQNKKSTFYLNFALFFAGFIFYVMTLIIAADIYSTPALERFSIVLDFLPGNIVWGMLAFNGLTSFLLRKPKFEKNEKGKMIGYRLCALIPLTYMIASSLIQIGKKAWGWKIPFEVTSLFFSKALIITAFSILYCLVIFLYRKIVDLKFGKENAEIYALGNRYQFIKNFLIAAVLALLGVADLLLGKTDMGTKIGFGSNIGVFFLIPLVLFYHPHRGPRNKKWDLVFNVAYGFSMTIGIVCIISSISIFITSL